jgi:hypothetical protein
VGSELRSFGVAAAAAAVVPQGETVERAGRCCRRQLENCRPAGIRLTSGEHLRLTQYLDAPVPLREHTEVDMKYPIARDRALEALGELLRELGGTMTHVARTVPE